MKKCLISLFSLLCVFMLFVSCGKKAVKDDCGCFVDLEAAKSYAQKKNIPVLIVVTSEGDDELSTDFVRNILNAADFADKIGNKYAVYHADFSAAAFAKTTAGENASKEERAAAEAYSLIMENSYQNAIALDVTLTPSAYVTTKDGYVVSEVEFGDNDVNLNSFAQLLESYTSKIQKFDVMVAATKKGSASDKVEAIDTLYRATDSAYRSFLIDLVKKVPELDKNNETGLCGKYIVAAADSNAMNYYSKGDLESALKEYLTAADNQFVKAEDKQECFYTAAYFVAYSGSDDFTAIIQYLNLAYQVAPESSKAPAIKDAITYFETLAENSSSIEE